METEVVPKVKKDIERLLSELNDIDAALDGGEKKDITDKNSEDIAGDVDDDFFASINEFKESLNRANSYRKELNSIMHKNKTSVKYESIEELKKITEKVFGLGEKTDVLLQKYEGIELLRDKLDTIVADDSLNNTLESFTQKLDILSSYDDKINKASASAAEQMDKVKKLLDDRLTDLKKMERELLTSNYDLKHIVDKLEAQSRNCCIDNAELEKISEKVLQNTMPLENNIIRQINNLNLSIGRLEENFEAVASNIYKTNMKEKTPASNVSENNIYKTVCMELAGIIYNENNEIESRKVLKFTNEEKEMMISFLTPALRNKIAILVKAINHFRGLYVNSRNVYESYFKDIK